MSSLSLKVQPQVQNKLNLQIRRLKTLQCHKRVFSGAETSHDQMDKKWLKSQHIALLGDEEL